MEGAGTDGDTLRAPWKCGNMALAAKFTDRVRRRTEAREKAHSREGRIIIVDAVSIFRAQEVLNTLNRR